MMPALIFGYALGYFSMAVFPLWITGIATAYGISSEIAGLVSSAELGMLALTAFLLPALLERLNLRNLVLLATVGLIGGNLISIHAGSFYVFVLCRLLVGLCDGAVLATISTLAGQGVNPRETFANLQFAQVLSSMVFYGISATLIGHLGTAGVFGYYAVFSCLCLLPLRQLPEHSAIPGPMESTILEASSVSLWRIVPGLAGLMLLATSVNTILASVVPLGLHSGLPISTISLTMALSGSMGLVGSLAAQRLGDRLGIILPLLVAAVMLASAAVIFGQAKGLFSFASAAILLLSALFFVIPYLMGEIARLDASGRSVARGQAAMMIGSAIGPAAGGAALSLCGIVGLTTIVAMALMLSILPFALAALGSHARQASGRTAQ